MSGSNTLTTATFILLKKCNILTWRKVVIRLNACVCKSVESPLNVLQWIDCAQCATGHNAIGFCNCLRRIHIACEQKVLATQHGFAQCSLRQVVIQRYFGVSEKTTSVFPARIQLCNCLSQVGLGWNRTSTCKHPRFDFIKNRFSLIISNLMKFCRAFVIITTSPIYFKKCIDQLYWFLSSWITFFAGRISQGFYKISPHMSPTG